MFPTSTKWQCAANYSGLENNVSNFSEFKKNVALLIAFETFTSGGPHHYTPAEAMEFSDEVWDEEVIHWAPFQEETREDVSEYIWTLADRIEQAISDGRTVHE